MAEQNSKEYFYNGSFSSLNASGSNFVGFRPEKPGLHNASMGFPGSPSTANQLGETVNAIKQGVKVFEVTFLGPAAGDKDQVMPAQHLKEIRAITKLTGVKPSVHGVLVDAAGFSQGGWGGESEMKENERRMWDSIERAHIIDPKSNIPVVFHTSNGTPGIEYRPDETKKPGEEGRFVPFKVPIIDKDNGRVLLTGEHREYNFKTKEKDLKAGIENYEKGGTITSPIESMKTANKDFWNSKVMEMTLEKNRINNHIKEDILQIPDLQILLNKKNEDQNVVKEMYNRFFKDENSDDFKGMKIKIERANRLLDISEDRFEKNFERAFKFGDEKQKNELIELSKEYEREKKQFEKEKSDGSEMTAPQLKEVEFKLNVQDKMMSKFNEVIKDNAPTVYENVEEFAMKKASETFSNLAKKSFEKFSKDGGIPTLAIENIFRGPGAFTRAQDTKKLIDMTRDKYKDYLIKEQKFTEKQADEQAKKQIGVTWDVGHINMLRKDGFTEEDIVQEVKTIAKDKTLVKHIHITDNFGYTDSHLPPGMGNVPLKKHLEELEKTGRIHEMRKIIETGNFVGEFKISPHVMGLNALGSSIYGLKMDPVWNQASGITGNYFAGHGNTNPQIHQSLYGRTFTGLPTEFGGQQMSGSSQSRFSGTSMT